MFFFLSLNWTLLNRILLNSHVLASQLGLKLDRVDPLMTDPTPTSSKTLKKKKKSTYGRHQLSWPMRIVEPKQIWRGCVIYFFYFFFPPPPPPPPSQLPSAPKKGRVGQSWAKLGRVRPSWAELGRVGPSWAELGRVGPSWAERAELGKGLLRRKKNKK